MGVSLVISVFIVIFVALVVFGAIWFLIMEALDRVESFKKRAPTWLTKFIESRQSFIPLFVLCIMLLVGDGYQLLLKEIPEVPKPPVVEIKPPAGPTMNVTRINPPMREQCWIKNYAAPALATSSWGLATIFCNTTIKPPYSVELNYDQSVVVGPFTFPVGSEFAKSTEYNQGTKIVGMFDLHTIIPNEPFSIMAHGSSDKFPTVKTATIRAKGIVFEFHP